MQLPSSVAGAEAVPFTYFVRIIAKICWKLDTETREQEVCHCMKLVLLEGCSWSPDAVIQSGCDIDLAAEY